MRLEGAVTGHRWVVLFELLGWRPGDLDFARREPMLHGWIEGNALGRFHMHLQVPNEVLVERLPLDWIYLVGRMLFAQRPKSHICILLLVSYL